jgi:hypothetical protein
MSPAVHHSPAEESQNEPETCQPLGRPRASGLEGLTPATAETNGEDIALPSEPEGCVYGVSGHAAEHVDAITEVTKTERAIREIIDVKDEGFTTPESVSEQLGIDACRHTMYGTRSDDKKLEGNQLNAVEESFEARIERLGRERPRQFKSLWAEIGFCFSISMSQVLTVSALSVLNPLNRNTPKI